MLFFHLSTPVRAIRLHNKRLIQIGFEPPSTVDSPPRLYNHIGQDHSRGRPGLERPQQHPPGGKPESQSNTGL
jgi:hypothetical protein